MKTTIVPRGGGPDDLSAVLVKKGKDMGSLHIICIERMAVGALRECYLFRSSGTSHSQNLTIHDSAGLRKYGDSSIYHVVPTL